MIAIRDVAIFVAVIGFYSMLLLPLKRRQS